MRIILALLLLAAPALSQSGDIAYQILFAMATRPDAEHWLEQKKFTPNDTQRLLLGVRQNSIVTIQNGLSPQGQEALTNLLAEIRNNVRPAPAYWSFLTSFKLTWAAFAVVGIVIPTTDDPIPSLKLSASSPSGRTTTKELKPAKPITVLRFDFPFCNEDDTLCEDGIFKFALNP